MRDTALVPCPPLRKNRAGRACGLCNVSDLSLPVAALRLWQRTTEGEFYGELSAPAPLCGGASPCLREFGSVDLGRWGWARRNLAWGEGPVTERLSTCAPGPFSAGGPGLGMSVCA